jgi:hypothetical protein
MLKGSVSSSCNLQASDGMFRSVATVTISVHDVNNNHPVFGRESYVVTLQEDTAIGKNSSYTNTTFHTSLSVIIIKSLAAQNKIFSSLFIPLK